MESLGGSVALKRSYAPPVYNHPRGSRIMITWQPKDKTQVLA